MREYKLILVVTLMALIAGMGISDADKRATNTKQDLSGFTAYKSKMDKLRGIK